MRGANTELNLPNSIGSGRASLMLAISSANVARDESNPVSLKTRIKARARKLKAKAHKKRR